MSTPSFTRRAVLSALSAVAVLHALAMQPQSAHADAVPMQSPPQEPGQGLPPVPPQAFEACQDHHEGDACTVTVQGLGTLTGTCAPWPQGGLVCRPAGMPPRP